MHHMLGEGTGHADHRTRGRDIAFHLCCCASVGQTSGAIDHVYIFCRPVHYGSTADLLEQSVGKKVRASNYHLKSSMALC